MQHRNGTVEEVVGRIASASHGVVTRAELLQAGITREEIRRRLQTGALLREYPGIYRVGHRAPSLEARYMAAVRACGRDSLLAGRAAGYLWGLLKGSAPPPEVIAPTDRCVRGLVTHRCRRMGAEDAAVWRGIPVTTAARTLVDLSSALAVAELARACHEAGIRHKTTPAQIEAVLARRHSSPGAGKLRRILRGDVRVTLSGLEARFLARVRHAELPLPQTNRPAGGRRVDCRWPERRLTVELDGYEYHHSRYAWEQDRRREREARARGDEFRRYTYGDVFDQPRFMLAELRVLLTESRPG
jgi:very-short-patch-repair endonuclease